MNSLVAGAADRRRRWRRRATPSGTLWWPHRLGVGLGHSAPVSFSLDQHQLDGHLLEGLPLPRVLPLWPSCGSARRPSGRPASVRPPRPWSPPEPFGIVSGSPRMERELIEILGGPLCTALHYALASQSAGATSAGAPWTLLQGATTELVQESPFVRSKSFRRFSFAYLTRRQALRKQRQVSFAVLKLLP
jgi:hypothetical protein